MSVDREYKIKISTVADPTGANQAADSLRTVTSATSSATEATKEATKHTGLLAGGHKELHKLIHSVSEAFPLVGIAARAAFSVVGAGITAAILLFREIKKHIEEVNAELDKMGEAAAKPLGDMKESLFDANKAVADSREMLEAWRASMADGLKAQTSMYDHAITKLHEQTKATLELIGAQEKAGLISPLRSATAASRTQGRSDAEEIGIKSRQLGIEKANLSLLERQAAKMEADLLDKQKQAKDIDKGRVGGSLADEAKALVEELKKAKAEAEGPQAKYDKERSGIERIFGKRVADVSEADKNSPLGRARAALEAANGNVESVQGRIAMNDRAREALQRQNIEIEHSAKVFQELREKIAAINASITGHENSLQDFRVTTAIGASTRSQKAGIDVAGMQHTFATNAGTKELKEDTKKLQAMLASLGWNSAAQKAAMDAILHHLSTQNTYWAAAKKRAEDMQKQIDRLGH